MFAAIALLLAVVVYRVVTGFSSSGDHLWLLNIAPLAAIVLCGAVYLPKRMAIVLPLAMLAISDVILNVFLYHWPLTSPHILSRYVAYAIVLALGFALRGRARWPELIGASIVGSLIFYVVTNTGSWIAEPLYAKTFAGWIQALSTGTPGHPPTWWFYRQTFIGDIVFTVLFVGCMKWQSHREAARVPARREQLVPW